VVVVGGGAAGCAVARRLSEDPSCRVCLLEAGPDRFAAADRVVGTPFADDMLALFWDEEGLAGFAKHGWEYAGFAFAGDRHPLTSFRGRALGGSTATNGAAWIRGAPQCYDAWGSDLWTYERVLPYFRRSESDGFGDREYHGDEGPVPVERMPRERWWPFHLAVMDAARGLGFAEKADVNDPRGEGFGPVPRNQVDGMRVSSAASYLGPVRGRANLEIRCDSPVARVLLGDGRATGVELEGGERIAAGEVVLCAGGLESPHLLMLSGIGPARDLAAAGIEVVAELPGVGQNLRDHPIVPMPVEVTRTADVGSGGMAYPGMLQYTAPGSSACNDIQMWPRYLGAPVSAAAGPVRDLITVDFHLHDALSCGCIVLDPENPRANPRIEFRYLSEAEDRRRLVSALRLGREIVESDPCRELEARLLAPGADAFESDAGLERYLESSLATNFHSSGTCKLGPAADPTAVVDERCRVHGIERLRVADLSIPPLSVGNGAASAVMIGERAADLVREG
jgi:choline dehydrogenase-like flavoprotein